MQDKKKFALSRSLKEDERREISQKFDACYSTVMVCPEKMAMDYFVIRERMAMPGVENEDFLVQRQGMIAIPFVFLHKEYPYRKFFQNIKEDIIRQKPTKIPYKNDIDVIKTDINILSIPKKITNIPSS